jgi:hypothetical protein
MKIRRQTIILTKKMAYKKLQRESNGLHFMAENDLLLME